jgi:hypothetical protein
MPETATKPSTGQVPAGPSTQHLFWARELVKLAREQATKKGVPDHVMAQAMMVQSWMLFTGQSEEEARKSVSGLYAASLAKKVAAKPKEPKASTKMAPTDRILS